ncbi:CDP-glycerol glycerophosphotransferase family protein [Halorientalis brevis]|uniref:CDP-glycerol glycerophosphotransferase family protein n=1 Tax=Halorientalis brevis TaxID=1126241 RepID=A0ABD6C5N0_9EURY|nr:CDP-glycerol glycerophosphotransferase family protein [Halorientalis brevis]
MVTILYTFDRRFMRKTFVAIDRYVDASSAVLPLRPEAGCPTSIPVVQRSIASVEDLDAAVFDIDPDVVVQNHRFGTEVLDERPAFQREYPLVHVRHGASLGRGEARNTTRDLGDVVDLALAPGEQWARHYREEFPDDVDVRVVGIPEADELVSTDPPRERRVLYAPTNHNYGGGSYLRTATQVLDTFADSEYELRFRPHPMDRIEEPGRTLTEACKERIADLPNVTFDDTTTPRESMLWADLLISDCSGIITEWLHTGRPLLQVTDTEADLDVPVVGMVTEELSLATVDQLYEHGYPASVARERSTTLADLGVPMDGRAGKRAATEVMACTQ